jgi:DNA-binding NarL/FixJ family response regulator
MLLIKEDHAAAGRHEQALRVLIADDHPLVLLGVRRTLDECEDIEVVGEAHSAREVIALAERRNPDVVLTDLRMPGTQGGDLITTIRERHPDLKVVVLSASDDAQSIKTASDAGACAFVVKSVRPTDLPSVLRQAGSGAIQHIAGPRAAESYAEVEEENEFALTTRERTVLEMVASGKTSRAISGELWLSEHTVKFHLTNIYRKLGVPNRSGAVRCAIECGLVAADG